MSCRAVFLDRDGVINGAVVRDGKPYQISKEWLLATKSSVDQLLLAYDERRNRAAAMAQLVSEDHSVFTLHSLYELDNFWGDVFKTCYQKISPDDPRGIVCCWHYTWWLVFNFGRETDLFGSAVRQGYCIENRIFYDLPLNRWAAEVYRSVGAEVKIGKNPDLDDSVAFNMIGDDILQVEYPSSVMKVIAPMFQDYEHLHDIDQKAVTDLAHARHDIRFSMFTNSVIADQLRRTYQCL